MGLLRTSAPRPPLDPVVKIGLTVFIGGFALIAAGMFLSRPDRTIPPYSIGSQEGVVVAVHVPASTSDPAIETLIRRFREVGLATRDFRSLKVRPTTPGDPRTFYREVVLYIFSDPVWTQPALLHRYLAGHDGEEEAAWRRAWQGAARGGFLYTRGRTRGWIGPIPDPTCPGCNHAIRPLFDDGAASQSHARAARCDTSPQRQDAVMRRWRSGLPWQSAAPANLSA